MLGIRSTSLATYNSAPYDTIFAVPAQAFFEFLFRIFSFSHTSGTVWAGKAPKYGNSAGWGMQNAGD
jgi:hypothetical protein